MINIRLGIIGSGRIAKRFASELFNESGITLDSVYNVKYESAKRFSEAFNKVTPTSNLEEFFDLVDAIYIASPHETHFSYVKQALISKKHVLCEKPMCFSLAESEELYDIADSNNLVLMEALKSLYMPGFKKLCDVVSSGTIGKIHMVEATFTKLVEEGNREYCGEYAGAISELSSYGLLAVLSVLGSQYKGVRAEKIKNKDNVDIFSRIHFEYNDAFATVNVGIGAKSEGSMIISGETGYIYVPAPWWFFREFSVRRENPNVRENFECECLGEGLSYEIDAFKNRIKNREFTDNRGLSICISSLLERIVRG